ncbi:MAG: glycosyltransferase family 4 protein [Bacteroidales bacterium]|nr:glycosyltransferase family 4 protein [Bacteroidales bacterium]
MKRYIVVNATALDRSGALSILRQFVENIPVDNRKWLIFVSPIINISTDNPNVRIEPIEGVKPMHKRLIWDALGLKKWLKKNKIEPVASISLQNTGFNVGKKVPNYIYYHQSIPFYPFKWNPLKKQERTFWFYKKIYPFFVNLFLKKDSQIFVQLEFIKDGFAKRFKYFKKLIGVYSPAVSTPKNNIERESGTTNVPRLLYPAMPHFYKNHRIISEALEMTDAEVEVLFTIGPDDYTTDDERIKLIGMQSYERICELYRTYDALLFPSYIETFGLPLLEAAMTGLPILASDLPYAREVLAGYEGVTFIPYNNAEAWAKAINSIEKGKRYKPIVISNRPGWKELFENIK